jgi:hypothetical protein
LLINYLTEDDTDDDDEVPIIYLTPVPGRMRVIGSFVFTGGGKIDGGVASETVPEGADMEDLCNRSTSQTTRLRKKNQVKHEKTIFMKNGNSFSAT